MERMSYLIAVSWLSSTFIFVNFRWPPCWPASSSRIGSMTLHGPHHGAQKSTTTGVSADSTSDENVVSVTSIMDAANAFLLGLETVGISIAMRHTRARFRPGW